MKRFLLQFCLFILPILIIVYPIDYFLSNQLKKNEFLVRGEFSTWNDLYEGRVQANIAVYGSSRAWTQISPTILTERLHQQTYNLGIDGYNLPLQYFRHQLLLQYNKKPSLIIHSVDMFTLEKRDGLVNSEQFLPYMLGNQDMCRVLKDYKGFGTGDYSLPLVRFYGNRTAILTALKTPLKGSGKRIREYGYQAQDFSWNADFAKAKMYRKSIEIKIDKSLLNLFNRYLSECREKGIKIVLIYAPEHIDGQKFVHNRQYVIDLYESLAKKYNIPFVDYSSNDLCFDKANFYNASHLNKKGSEAFSYELADKIKALRVL